MRTESIDRYESESREVSLVKVEPSRLPANQEELANGVGSQPSGIVIRCGNAAVEMLAGMQMAAIAELLKALSNTAQNLCKHKARTRSRFSDSPDAVMNTAAGNEGTVEDKIILSEDIAIMKRAILRLSEKEQAALKMKFVMDETDEVIAEQIDMAPGSVRQCIKRARDKLKRMHSSCFYPFVQYGTGYELYMSYTVDRQHIRLVGFTLSKYL